MSRRPKSPFEKSRAVEEAYARDLRRIGTNVGRILDAYDPDDPGRLPPLLDSLRQYAEVLTPWAEARADLMLQEINRQDARAWRIATEDMSRSLRLQLQGTPTAGILSDLRKEQVVLIRSLPLDAADRAQKLAMQAYTGGTRSSSFIEEIWNSGEVSRARATSIARTEPARAASNFTQARSLHVGSEGYTWRTSRDADVRPSHHAMEGKYVPWNRPPTLDKMTGHAGCFPNCRCYPEPLVPRKFLAT